MLLNRDGVLPPRKSWQPQSSVLEVYSSIGILTDEPNTLIISLISLFVQIISLASHHVRLVEETLEPLDPDRRAFRLVGGVLVERTVKEVLPTVKEHRNNVRIIHLSLFIIWFYYCTCCFVNTWLQ